MKTTITTERFAAWILDRARMSDDRIGRKVLLASLADEAGIARDEFNALLLAANRARLITLARVDWVASGDYSLLDASLVSDRGSDFHAVVDESYEEVV